jgi:hypothetical protein
VAAQEQRGGLEGIVKDNTGAVLPGVAIEATSPTSLGALTAVTDAAGYFRLSALLPGEYTVTATLSGFTVAKARVPVTAGAVPRVELALQVSGVAEQVQVTADTSALDMGSSRTATVITAEVIKDLPPGRTFNTLLQLAPGVRPEPKAGSAGVGGYQVDGASGSENVFVVDGVDVSSVRNSSLGAANAIPFEFVTELQVNSGGFNAEYGGALGGVVNVVSKSGTDVFRGEGLYQFSGSSLNSGIGNTVGSSSYRTFRRNPDNVTEAEFFQAPEDDYTEQFYGFTLGGPIVMQKMRFFLGYIPQFYDTTRSINFRTGGLKETNKKEIRHRGIGRLDYSPTQSMQINGSYMWNPKKTKGLLSGNDFKVTPPTSDFSRQGGYEPANQTSLGVNYIPSAKFLLSARYGYNYLNAKGDTYGKDDAPYYTYQTASNQGGLVVPAQFAGAAGFANVSNPFQTQYDRLTRHNVYLDATYFATIGGQNHTIKGGYMLNRLADDVQSNYPQGFFQIFWNEDFDRASIQNERGTYGYYIWQDGVRLNSAVSSRNHGFYVQDSWQVSSRLTINAGVRLENEYLPPFRAEQDGLQVKDPISFGWGDKIAPRLGAAWDVTGTGRWKLSGSYVRINDVLKYELARGSFGGDYWWSHVYRLNDPDVTKLNISNPAVLGPAITSFDNRAVEINAAGEIAGIDPDIKPMAHDAFDVTSDYMLTPRTTLTVRYVHKALKRAIEDIGILDEFGSEIYTIGNPGFGETSDSITTPSGASLVPKAKRDYDGLEVRLSGRKPNFYYSGSYTYSRLYGNWAGLANSDENGRSDPNVSRAFDLSPGNFNARGENVYGRLATDRPHTLKLYGSYTRESRLGATGIGVSQVAYSGTPISSEVTFIVPVFYKGRGDMGRTPALTQTDMFLSHGFRMGSTRRLVLEAYFLNLFNQDAVTNITGRFNRNGNLDPQRLYDGSIGDVEALINPVTGSSPSRNAIYGMPLAYQDGRRVTIGARFQF